MTSDHIELHSKFAKTAHLLVKNSPKYKGYDDHSQILTRTFIRYDLKLQLFCCCFQNEISNRKKTFRIRHSQLIYLIIHFDCLIIPFHYLRIE